MIRGATNRHHLLCLFSAHQSDLHKEESPTGTKISMMPLEQRPHSLSLLCTAAVTAANLVSAGGFEGEGRVSGRATKKGITNLVKER